MEISDRRTPKVNFPSRCPVDGFIFHQYAVEQANDTPFFLSMPKAKNADVEIVPFAVSTLQTKPFFFS